MAWAYQREEQHFDVVPEGKHRIRIRSAEKAMSKAGNDMLVLQFDVSGQTSILFNYIVFLDDKPEITNGKLTQFFDSFADIKDGDFNMLNWIGKVGACMVKHEEYMGEPTARISYFIKADKQGDLPPWKEPANGAGTPVTGGAFTEMEVPDIPF